MAILDQININGVVHEIVPEIAPLFDTSTAYAIGDYVIKDATMYRFKTAHTAGAWNASQVDEVTVGSEIKDIKQATSEIDTLKADLGDLSTLETTDKSSLVNAINEAAQSCGSGLTDTQKELIITILRNAMYTSDQSKNIDELEDAFANTVISISTTLDLRGNTIYSDDTLDTLRQYLVVRATYDDGTTQTVTGYALSGTLTVGTSTIQVIYRDASASVNVPVSQAVVRYIVTNNLTGVTNSNTDVTIAEGNTYTGILTAETTGYIPTNVSVTVGGTDVTSTVYDSSTHTITIANVQGNIVISASEGEDPYAPKFELTSPLVVGDTTDPRINDTANNRIATGVTIKDDETWTLCIDFTSNAGHAVSDRTVMVNDRNTKLVYTSPNWALVWHNNTSGGINDYSGGKFIGVNMKFVLTHEANATVAYCYGTKETTINNTHTLANDGQIRIGSTDEAGTINRFAIYKRVLTADEITAWIGE